MLTFNDVNRDFKAILDGVADANRPVPSTLDALKVASVIPLIGVIFSTITFWAVCANLSKQGMSVNLLVDGIISGDAIPIYMSVVIGLAQMIIVLPYVSLYHSIPVEVRNSTALIATFKKGLAKGVFIYVILLLALSLACFKNEIFLFSIPIIMFLATFVASLIVNLQVTKYGVGALIDKLKKILN
ncbi:MULTISPECIES: hypothetical protein [Enterobacteriaceae]|uniref:Conjugal transfer protein TraS n=1 Tax=Leclercia adecarboxylata TaxID=83655 RepID=A0A6H0A420_9ENTR|nr:MULTISPECIES: hypothetical protein [Enterobacteriaceae]UNJ80305.1 hypothetical protein [Leclercia sp.]MCW4706003.1 hypothetical protein [Enterobacter kobei]MDV5463908.1 hypothetical protein [Leclercia adecarboxylata]MDV5505759.1 hypothetical protein [Leclercia adecarboxylata]MDV5534898.1 hypothetical protein [Leclercia adecarboxylata]